jgi:inhibitor of cysteine peptidase
MHTKFSTPLPNSRRSVRVLARTLAVAALAAPVCALPFALAGCGGKPGPRMAIARVTHRLAEDTQHESTVEVGQELTNELPFSAGTGYAWTAKGFDTKVLALKGQESKSESTDGTVGGPMIEHFTFEGLKKGETTITFELRRPWEKDVAPAEKRTMKVKVVAAE